MAQVAGVGGTESLDAIISPHADHLVLVQRGASGADGVFVVPVKAASATTSPSQAPAVRRATAVLTTASPRHAGAHGEHRGATAEPDPAAGGHRERAAERAAAPPWRPTATPSDTASAPRSSPSDAASPTETAHAGRRRPSPRPSPRPSADSTPGRGRDARRPTARSRSPATWSSSAASPRYNADGTRFAFTARPADGSAGPDVYVWDTADAVARAVTTDHRSILAGWDGQDLLVSRVVDDRPATFAVDSQTGRTRERAWEQRLAARGRSRRRPAPPGGTVRSGSPTTA